METKHLVHIIMFGLVTSDGDIGKPFIFLHDLRFNTNAYQVLRGGSSAPNLEGVF